jgi:hypothetical protein
VAIEHDYFGIIDEDASGALTWSNTVELQDQVVEVELSAPGGVEVPEAALDRAAEMLLAVEGLDARARDALVAQLSVRESVTTAYIDQQVGTMGESLLDLLVHNSGDIAMDVLRSLQLVRIVLHPDQYDDDDVFAVFVYSIDPDATDDVLAVSFDDRADVVVVDAGE